MLAVLGATGLLGIAYEVIVVRVLSQVTEDTVYTFAILLAVYLAATALGAAVHQRASAALRMLHSAPAALLCAQAAACLLGGSSLWAAEWLRDAVQHATAAGMAGALLAEAALALAAFGLPAVVMGMLFSELSTRARAAGIAWGRCLAVNMLGAALAPPLVGVLLVPALGASVTLALLVASYLALAFAVALAASRPSGARQPAVAAAGGAVTAALLTLALWAPPLTFVDVPTGGRVLNYREGALAAVSVVEDADGVARLRINNRQQEGSSASLLADGRQALLPLLLHPAPRRALFLGLGTGLTAATAAQDPALTGVDAVELLPEVIAASTRFRAAWPGGGATNPRLHLLASDARRFVRSSGPRYDVIVSDNFHPARSGSGSLYTVDHFAAVRARLASGGLFCQWLPLHQLDLDTLRSIVRAFTTVYPGAWALLATNSLQTPVLGLLARADAADDSGVALAVQRLDTVAVRQRLAGPAWPAVPFADFGLPDELAVLGSFVAGPRALARFAGSAELNTDDHPVVAYRAPRVTYAPDTSPGDRLLALLQQLSIQPAELLGTSADAASQQRLAAYWAARNAFIAAGRGVRLAGSVQDMLRQVREPLLAVLRISPDFRPAYDPLLRMALTLGDNDFAASQALLRELTLLQPARLEAAQALRW